MGHLRPGQHDFLDGHRLAVFSALRGTGRGGPRRSTACSADSILLLRHHLSAVALLGAMTDRARRRMPFLDVEHDHLRHGHGVYRQRLLPVIRAAVHPGERRVPGRPPVLRFLLLEVTTPRESRTRERHRHRHRLLGSYIAVAMGILIGEVVTSPRPAHFWPLFRGSRRPSSCSRSPASSSYGSAAIRTPRSRVHRPRHRLRRLRPSRPSDRGSSIRASSVFLSAASSTRMRSTQ